MNILEVYLKQIKEVVKKNSKVLGIENLNKLEVTNLETPPSNFNFDFSSNIAMILAKQNNNNPKELAAKIKAILLEKITDFSIIEIAGPGFININLNNKALNFQIKKILKTKKKYGSNKKRNKYNLEFVSANPTGPMHVGHCRGAIFGDVLSNLLTFNGNKVVKEYYINDHGNQIVNFTESVFLRLRELKYNEKFEKKENLYPGEYIKDIAIKILKKKPKINLEKNKYNFSQLQTLALKHSLDLIKDDLNKLGIKHDIFVSENKLIKKKIVEKAVEKLKRKKYVNFGYLQPPKGEENTEWKKVKRLIFKSTLFGDDTDRALQKNDGSWTYFATDIGYHSTKLAKKYDVLINILGADHTGYIKRISAAVDALSDKKNLLKCKTCQLVKLYKNGQPFKMSKRAGDFISVKELLDEVNKDSIRFMMLSRSNDVELDFDFDKVLEKNKDNPVFYVQYCYARINSLFKNLKINLKKNIKINETNFSLNLYERQLLRKIFDWPKVIETSSTKYEPHRISFYLYELATLFHSYWTKGSKDEKYRFVNKGKAQNINSLIIIQLLALVVENGMKILGVSLPKKM